MLTKLKALRNQAGEEGFTLIELLVVIIIIGILSAIALPLFFNQQSEAIKAGVKSDVRNTVAEVTTYLVKSPTATNEQMTVVQTGIYHPTSNPGAGTGAANIKPVVSHQNTTVSVSGNWKNWRVQGINTAVKGKGGGQYGYWFQSINGTYDEISYSPPISG